MSAPHFQVGEECYIASSPSYPDFIGRKVVVIGTLAWRPAFNKFGEFCGMSEAYKIDVDGEQYCAPQKLLRKQRPDLGTWEGTAWQPKREAR